MNEPGWKVGVPSAEFTMPPAPIAGRVSVPVGVSETTLSPDSVIMYAVVPAAFTAIMRGLVLNRVVPKTLTTGFSGTTPASVSSPVCRLTIQCHSFFHLRVGIAFRTSLFQVWARALRLGNLAPCPQISRGLERRRLRSGSLQQATR